MTALLSQFFAPILPYILAALVAAAGIFGFGAAQKRKGRKEAEAKAEAQRARAEREAHERIDHADTGAGATDGERIERLRDFAARHGNRPPEARGR